MKISIKKIFLAALIPIVLYSGYKLVKGEKKALKVLENHKTSSIHSENIIAHRGFSSRFSDNSYMAINEALNSDCVDMIEIDLRLTHDKKIVLHHAPIITIEDITMSIDGLTLTSLDKDLIIANYPRYSLDDLLYDDTLFLAKRFIEKQHTKGDLINLEDLLEWYSFSKPLLIDVKVRNANYDFINSLANTLKGYEDKVLIQSDCYSFLTVMQKEYQEFRYIFIINSLFDLKKEDNNFYGYTVKYSLLDKMEITNDKIYLIYTINSNAKYFNLLNNPNYQSNMYIITDDPDYICALSEDKKLRK